MKKVGILHPELSKAIAIMGHTDRLVVCDAGLPIPVHAERIDLALTEGIPKFQDVLRIVLSELEVESAIVARELSVQNNDFLEKMKELMPDIEISQVPHEQFKELSRENGRTIFVRTGETTPYANIILISGVTF